MKQGVDIEMIQLLVVAVLLPSSTSLSVLLYSHRSKPINSSNKSFRPLLPSAYTSRVSLQLQQPVRDDFREHVTVTESYLGVKNG